MVHSLTGLANHSERCGLPVLKKECVRNGKIPHKSGALLACGMKRRQGLQHRANEAPWFAARSYVFNAHTSLCSPPCYLLTAPHFAHINQAPNRLSPPPPHTHIPHLHSHPSRAMMASSDQPGSPSVQPAPGGAMSVSPEPEEEDTSAAARAALAPSSTNLSSTSTSATTAASVDSPANKIKAKLNEAGEDLKRTNDRLTAENAKVEGEHESAWHTSMCSMSS
jgi:hypothetical protein